jgi:hypothetical protein
VTVSVVAVVPPRINDSLTSKSSYSIVLVYDLVVNLFCAVTVRPRRNFSSVLGATNSYRCGICRGSQSSRGGLCQNERLAKCTVEKYSEPLSISCQEVEDEIDMDVEDSMNGAIAQDEDAFDNSSVKHGRYSSKLPHPLSACKSDRERMNEILTPIFTHYFASVANGVVKQRLPTSAETLQDSNGLSRTICMACSSPRRLQIPVRRQVVVQSLMGPFCATAVDHV